MANTAAEDWWGRDAISGSGLPALYSLLAIGGGPGGAGCAAGGVCLTLVYVAAYSYVVMPRRNRCPYRWERPMADLVYLYNSLLRVSLNSAQIFRQASLVDSDVGAGLCVAPLYVLLCMQGGSSAKYKGEMSLVATLLSFTILVVAAARAASGDAGDAPSSTEDSHTPWAYLFAVSDSTYAFSNMGGWWDGDTFSPWRFAPRAAVFIAVGASPSLLWSLVGPQPAWLFVGHGALMVMSAMIQAGQTRERLSAVSLGQRRVRAPHRSMMLVVAPALAVGFVYQWWDPRLASVAVVAFILWDLFIFCLQWTDGDVMQH
jgi:hypothetical protein